jgi:glycosyltransferase involved in cell wall biosynthesis
VDVLAREAPSLETAESTLQRTRVAVVHDWLTTYVGGERVVEQMLAVFPQAEVFASIDVLEEHERAFLGGRRPTTSPAQRWPFVRKHYRALLPLLMFAIEQLDVSDHELVLSSSASIAKGVVTGPDQLHISYVHSPMRYAWDMQHQYLRTAGLESGLRSLVARLILHRARLWDLRTANGVDHFIANSHFIARRIWRVYRRRSTVIYPPVDVDRFTLRESKEEFYLCVSRMVPYKKIPAIVAAFGALPDKKLVVIGDGTEMKKVRAVASSNVELLGYQPFSVVRDCMQRARALVFAAEEDFGISLVEAQACGTPVIAFGRGGAIESIRGAGHPQPTGQFFDRQDPESIARAVREFERRPVAISPQACRENAQRFAVEVFRRRYAQYVTRCWDRFQARARRRREVTTPEW